MRHTRARVPAGRRPATAAVALALAVVAAMGLTGSAEARGLKTGIIDQELFLNSDPSTQATWFNRAVEARSSVIRIGVGWSSIAGNRPPAHPTNPAEPDYNFSSLDAAVRAATARNLEILFTVNSAPTWAEGKNRPASAPAGTWKPDPHALGQFAQALAKRYSGGFRGLPRVGDYELWNEPNLSVSLTPQWQGKHSTSPALYRAMLNAFYAGVHKGEPGATVIAGATAPFGDPRTHPRDPNLPRMRPLTFLRKVLCLNEKLKATRCPSKPHLDALSHHPINFLNPPHYQAINPNDVEVADFHKVASVLHAAEHAGTIAPKARAHHPLWASELGWYTKPPTSFGVPATKQARWFEESLHLLWKQGASVAVNFLIRDRNTTSRFATTSGLFYKSGGQKPAYRAFRFPFVTQRKSKSEVSVWSMPPGSGTLKLQRRGRKGWRTLKRVPAHSGKVTTTTIRLRGRASLRGNLRGDTSLAWRQR